ncbi:hypothetical protein [Archangium violaceum]|uniref:hypothetical protein n=1 Tax=Archangium violaceum TaxID=83451 RepID=UPI0036DEAF72
MRIPKKSLLAFTCFCFSLVAGAQEFAQDEALARVIAGTFLTSSDTIPGQDPDSGLPNRPLDSLAPSCGALVAGQALARGQTLWSCAGNARLVHQTDGNVVIYDRLGALWHTGTHGSSTSRLVMQGDGNFVLYAKSGAALWHTATGGNPGNPGAYVVMQGDCNLVVYNARGVPLGATFTTCR